MNDAEVRRQRLQAIAERDYRDDYVGLQETLRALGRSAQTNETTRRIAQRAFIAISRLQADRSIPRESEA